MSAVADNHSEDAATRALAAARDWHFGGLHEILVEHCNPVDDHTFVSLRDPNYVVHWWARPRELVASSSNGLVTAEGIVVTVERRGIPILTARLKVRRHPMDTLPWVRKQWPKSHFVQRDELYVGLDAKLAKWISENGLWGPIEPTEFYKEVGLILLERDA